VEGPVKSNSGAVAFYMFLYGAWCYPRGFICSTSSRRREQGWDGFELAR